MMRSKIVRYASASVLTLLGATGTSQPASAKIIRFSVPGSTTTIPAAINDAGWIAGNYADATRTNRGFLRAPDGTITLIDEPSSKCETYITGITESGVVIGQGGDITCRIQYGFVRSIDGTFTTFSVPGAPATYVTTSNNKGVAVGVYEDGSNDKPYLRSLDGSFTTIAPHRGYAATPTGINRKDEVVGTFVGRGGAFYAFLRNARGKFSTFAVANTVETIPLGINDSGEICGGFYANGTTGYFRRNVDGTYQTLPLSGAIRMSAINNEGTAIGYVNNGSPRGFIWKSDNTVKTFAVKNSLAVEPTAINGKGAITGMVAIEGHPGEAFLRTP